MREGRNSFGLRQLVKEFLDGKIDLIGIEIGSYAGESAEIFLSSNAFKKFYCIDPWEPGFDPNDKTTSDGLVNAEKQFNIRFENNKIVAKLKNKSSDVLNLFEDNSIDFIYIDGNHQYDFVKWDIEHYYNKVKNGGIISGHDYEVSGFTPHIRGVKKAVDEFFKKPPLKIYSDNSWIYIKL